MSQPPRAAPSKLALVLPMIAVGVLAAVAIPLWKWHRWATAGETPYDEIGIEVNSYMPGPLRDWACGRIAQRFPGSIPPYGCASARSG